MITGGAFAAKTRVAALLEQAANGEEVVITNHEKPIARLLSAAAMDRQRFDRLPITTDTGIAGRARQEILALAWGEKLTTRDAAYLELAIRRGAPLASKNVALTAAAARVGVPVIPGRGA